MLAISPAFPACRRLYCSGILAGLFHFAGDGEVLQPQGGPFRPVKSGGPFLSDEAEAFMCGYLQVGLAENDIVPRAVSPASGLSLRRIVNPGKTRPRKKPAGKPL